MTKECSAKRCGLLVVDDDPEMASTLAELLGRLGNPVYTALSGPEALAILAREPCICVVLADLVMPVMDGIALLRQIHSNHPEIAVLLMSGFATIESAVSAMREGAEDYLTKPFEPQAVLRKVGRLLELFDLKERIAVLESPSGSPWDTVVGRSPAMQRVRERAKAASLVEAPALIVGETGTGKELLARCIHSASPRAAAPFIPVNCGALPRDLMESELFGHRKGAFTGAHADRKGLAAAAAGGTLLLDEITEMPKDLQVKLLRLLEDGEVRPLGESQAVNVDVRVISTSNRPLREIRQQYLREDLFFRISAITVEVPPLRERREDIPWLAEHCLRLLNEKYGRTFSLEPRALGVLGDYSFPGNVRELENLLASAMALAPEGEQTLRESQFRSLVALSPPEAPASADASLLSLEELERFAIQQALRVCEGNKSRAAELLGISRDSLYRKLKSYQLE